jgi:hypothetical protein
MQVPTPLYFMNKEEKPRMTAQEKFNQSNMKKYMEVVTTSGTHTLYLFLSTYKEILLLFCDNTEFGVAESPVEVEADPRKLPVPEMSCQL